MQIKFKRIFALVLCCFLIIGVMPVYSFAEEETPMQIQSQKQITKTSENMLEGESVENGDIQVNEQVFPTGIENQFEIQLDVIANQLEFVGEASEDSAVLIMVDKSSSMNGYSPIILDTEQYRETQAQYPELANISMPITTSYSSSVLTDAKAVLDQIDGLSDEARQAVYNCYHRRAWFERKAVLSFLDVYTENIPEGVHRYFALCSFHKDAKTAQTWIDVNQEGALESIKSITHDYTRGTVFEPWNSEFATWGYNSGGSVYTNGSGTNIEGAYFLIDNLMDQIAKTDKVPAENMVSFMITDGEPTAYVNTSRDVTSTSRIYGTNMGADNHVYTDEQLSNIQTRTASNEYKLNIIWYGNATLNNSIYNLEDGNELYADGFSDVGTDEKIANLKISSEFIDTAKKIHKVKPWEVIASLDLDKFSYDGLSTNNIAKESTVSVENENIVWDLKSDVPYKTEGDKKYYRMNYLTTLDNTDEDFIENFSYYTNTDTVLHYSVIDSEVSEDSGEETVIGYSNIRNLEFDIPKVKGYLGGISFSKVDENSNALQGAEFTVTNGELTYTAVSSDEGMVIFERVPSARTYDLIETKAPDGFKKDGTTHTVEIRYGEVTFDGGNTELTVINKTQTPELNPDVVVVDYGKSIETHPLENDAGVASLAGISVINSEMGTRLASTVKGENGIFTVENDKILYSPFKYMSSIDRVTYCASVKGEEVLSLTENNSTVTVIPATTVYYEDNFGGSSENGGLYINYTGDWYTVSDDGTTTSGITANTDTTDRQDNGEVGQGNTPYGYDSSYADDIKFSNGSAAQATGSVSLVNGKPQFDASASFEFTGTGFDIISRTDLDCGMITVYIVDSNGKATNVPVINKGSNTLYQIPVISYTGLSYGTYTVTINVNAPVTALGITGSVFYLDAIRIYDPMGTSSADNAEFNEANAAYNADHEANAYVASIRDYILQVGKLDETETYGAVWVDTINNDYNGGGFIEQSSIKDFELTGPNEEVYLSPGYGIGFIVESTSIPDSVQLEIKVPAPLKNGARLSVQTIGESNVTNFDVTSATEMFYDISDAVVFTPTTVNGTTLYRATVILANGLPSQDAGEIVSITNIKMTYDDAKAVVATDSVSALTLDAETVEELDETQTEAVALKASWNVYVDVFDTVYTQHQASLPEYSVSSAETQGTVKSGQTVKATVKTSRYVDSLTVSDEYGSQAKITKVTSSVDESKILTEEYKTAKTWNIEFTVYGSNGTKAYTVSSANGEGETAQLDVTIENPTVESIKVYSQPNKTTYKYGESFDSTGMTLLVTYSDSTTKIIDSGYAVSPEKFTKTGTQKVTVSYGGKQTTVNVKVTYSLLQFVLKMLSFGLLWKM